MTQKTVLIVEDDLALAGAILSKLNNENFQTHWSRNVKDALKKLKELKTVDLIWLDHYLGEGGTGMDLLKIIKKNKNWKKIPVYLVSITASLDKIGEYEKLGIKKYFPKHTSALGDIIKYIKEHE